MSTIELPPSGRFNESQIRISVFPANEGPMAPIAKTPFFQAMKVAGAFEHDANFVSGYRGFVEVEADSIAVAGPGDLSKADREKITRTLRLKILETSRHPLVRFDLLGLRPEGSNSGDSGWLLEGRLSLHGEVRDVSVKMLRRSAQEYEGEFTIRQTDFRIAPVSAFLGALRSKDQVKILVAIDFHR